MRIRITTTFLVFTLAGLLGADQAHALTPREMACRETIAATVEKDTRLAWKVVQRCHRDRALGKRSLSDNCNDAVEADNRGKLVRARTTSRSKVVGACIGAETLLAQYPSCPAPAASVDDGGSTGGIDDFDELARCLFALANDGIGETSAAALGDADQRLLRALVDCQQSVGRGVIGLLRAHAAEGRRCQRASDAEGGDPDYSCEGVDSRGGIARARGALSDLVFDRCGFIPSEELSKLNACSADASGLADCAQNMADEHGAELIRNAYELLDSPATTTTSTTTTSTTTTTTSTTTTTMGTACGSSFPQCNGDCAGATFCQDTGAQCECVAPSGSCEPATILRSLNARYGTPSSETQLSTGWTGKTHVVDVPDDSLDALDVTCDENCENCDVSYNKRQGDPTTTCRCAGSPQTTCGVINGSDVASCGSVNPTCNCYYGPGLAISSGGTPVCVLNKIRQDYDGVMDLRTGTYEDVIKLSSLVHVGISQFAPCPTCDGDTTPGDGVRGGSCNGGLQNGQSCDVHGTHRTFGPTSFDCPPASSSNISGSGLQINLNLTSGTRSLTAALPCDAPNGALCPCRVCSGNSQLGCTSDAECTAAGAGLCTAGGDVSIQPNQCEGGLCGSDGSCTTGPVDKYCDGAVHADGRGFVSCTTDIDCSAVGAGACTVLDLRRCFPDPIVLTGRPDRDNPVTAAIFCIPPTTNIAVNQTAGLPGPGTFQIDVDTDVRCQSDPDLPYEYPDGANCPPLVTTTTTTTTTVTVPLPACGSTSFPTCGGTCPGAQACMPSVLSTCECVGG